MKDEESAASNGKGGLFIFQVFERFFRFLKDFDRFLKVFFRFLMVFERFLLTFCCTGKPWEALVDHHCLRGSCARRSWRRLK